MPMVTDPDAHRQLAARASPDSSARVRPWRVISSEKLVARRWLTVHEQRIALPHGGEIGEFHLIEAPDWAAVVAITDAGNVVLVDQYRHGAGRPSRELPAGVIEPGESPEEAARRELLEESGYTAKRWSTLITLCPEPARSTQRAHFFVAHDARRSFAQRPDPTEDIAVVELAPTEVVAAIGAGTIVHASHVGALLLAAQRGLLQAV